MKHLFIWENGDIGEFNLCASQCAKTIRLTGQSEILVATMNRTGDEKFSWADRVITGTGIKVKSSHAGSGLWQQLHNSGWTDPNIRSLVYESWSSLLRTEKPDVVYTWGSPSVTLICIMEDIKVVQMGSGANILEPSDTDNESDFPELQAWIYQFTDRPLGHLLHQPSFIFSDPRLDRKRTGMHFHLAPLLDATIDIESAPLGNVWPNAEIIMVKGGGEESKHLQDLLYALYGKQVAFMTKRDWYRYGVGVISGYLRGNESLLITHFDPIIFSQALYYEMNHIGLALNNFERLIARNACNAGLGVQLSGHPERIEGEIADAQLRISAVNKDKVRYCSMENAIKWITEQT